MTMVSRFSVMFILSNFFCEYLSTNETFALITFETLALITFAACRLKEIQNYFLSSSPRYKLCLFPILPKCPYS